MKYTHFIVLVTVLFAETVRAILPGVAPVDYKEHDVVELKVNKITSVKTQLPYHFYKGLPFCAPSKIENMDRNLGEILSGDMYMNSLYHVKFLEPVTCAVLGANELDKGKIAPYASSKSLNPPENCTYTYPASDVANFRRRIREEYAQQWTLDSLPVARVRVQAVTTDNGENQDHLLYEQGFPVGYVDGANNAYLYNHVTLTVKYHYETEAQAYRVVGFEAEPASYMETNPSSPSCSSSVPLIISYAGRPTKPVTVVWTYSVKWVEDKETTWSQRWNKYFGDSQASIHWFSILNSVMIILFLSGMIATILLRSFHADLRMYSEHLESREDEEEKGWKLVHTDVFRTPRHPALLSILVGEGANFFIMTEITLLCAILGLLSPANGGALIITIVTLVVLGASFSGYVSTRLYKMFGGPNWKHNIIGTAFLVPGVIFGIILFLNFFIWGAHSSGGVSFTALLSLMGLYIGVSLPLNFVGAYIGYKSKTIENTPKPHKIPRLLPQRNWYQNTTVQSLLGGLLPFSAVFIELYFILDSLWSNQYYYIFGFLFVVFLILVISCAEISMVMTYFQLCNEDYHWWWHSFITSGSSAIYFYLFSIFYFFSSLEITSFVSGLLYFGYSLVIAICFFVLTGFIGFTASFIFVRKMYSSVPLD